MQGFQGFQPKSVRYPKSNNKQVKPLRRKGFTCFVLYVRYFYILILKNEIENIKIGLKKITNTEQAGIEAGFLAENVAWASHSSRHSGRTAWKSCGFRVRFFRSEIANIPPRPYSGRPQDVRGTPAGVLLPCRRAGGGGREPDEQDPRTCRGHVRGQGAEPVRGLARAPQ